MAPPDDTQLEDDVVAQPITVPDTGDAGESGKLKMIVQLLKKCLGVKDIASMRLSLPASLLEPIPNLEYWHYLDRPDLFAAINDSDDPFERMLAVLRFAFSKDLKFIRGKVCKPYNSVLGEHFRSHWDVIPVSYPSDPLQPPIQHLFLTPAAAESDYSLAAASPRNSRLCVSETASISGRSIKSGRSVISALSVGRSTPGKSTPATSPSLGSSSLEGDMSNLNLADDASSRTELVEADDVPNAAGRPRVRIAFLTEQVSHHPPISAYYARCPSRNVELMGVDQISAKVSGTALRIVPGSYNKGLFVKLTGGPGEGETYRITHPIGAVNGMFRGSFYITMGEATIIECSGGADDDDERLRAVIEYKEESWLGKAHFLVEGVIHTYDPRGTAHQEWTRVKHVPRERVLATLDGSWKHRIRWRRANAASNEPATLLDLSTLHVIPKAVRPLEKQLPDESRKLWDNVTTRLLAKEYGEATRHKQAIEQRQRDEAAERKQKGIQFVPRYFENDIESGIPTLTAEGHRALEEELKEDIVYPLEDMEPAESQDMNTPSTTL